MRLRSIKEVSRLTGASEGALRYYNEKGVVTPTVKEDEGRRRWLYDDEAVTKLKKLFLLKYLRIPVSEIAQVIRGEVDEVKVFAKRLEKLKEDREKIDRQIMILQLLSAKDGELFSEDGELTDAQAAILNEMLAVYMKEGEEK